MSEWREGTTLDKAAMINPYEKPDLSRLPRAKRREIERHCTRIVTRDWRMGAVIAASAVAWVLFGIFAGHLFRRGGFWAGLTGAAVGGLVIGAFMGRVKERLARPYLAAELARRGLCSRCAYDLRGAPGACPECGEPAPPRVSN